LGLFERVKAFRWDTSRFASRLQGWVDPMASPRKVRLYAVAVGRRVWSIGCCPNYVEPYAPVFRELVEVNDRWEDGTVSLEERCQASLNANHVVSDLHSLGREAFMLRPAARLARSFEYAFEDGALDSSMFSESDNGTRLSLLRCIFGNPFRPVAFDPAWRTSDVVALAVRMYDARDFSPMPILADALQDAGCAADEVLNHCRGAGPHVRGCWVVDQVLGKS
jgi:hypothetical protein